MHIGQVKVCEGDGAIGGQVAHRCHVFVDRTCQCFSAHHNAIVRARDGDGDLVRVGSQRDIAVGRRDRVGQRDGFTRLQVIEGGDTSRVKGPKQVVGITCVGRQSLCHAVDAQHRQQVRVRQCNQTRGHARFDHRGNGRRHRVRGVHIIDCQATRHRQRCTGLCQAFVATVNAS